jgi:ABC-type glycerol-3-phosphate transport system substrate-binding protein
MFDSKIGRRNLIGAAGIGGAAAFAGAAGLRGGLIPSASAQDSVTLKIWTPGGSPLFCTMQDDLTASYNGVNANVKFEPVQCGVGGAGDFMQVLLGAIAAGNPPDATLLWQTPVALGARAGLVALDDMMADSQYAKAENWPAGLLETCQFKGQTYGLPVTAGIYTMWYNEELFEAKGIPSDRASFPKTWDELRALSKEFTVWDGDVLKSSGFMPWGVNYSITTDTFYVWSALNGGTVFDSANLKYTIDSEANVAMMQYALDWLDEEYHGDVNAVLNSGQAWGAYSDPTGPAAFQAGNLAAMMNGSWVMGDLYAEVEPVFTRWNLAPNPYGPGATASVSGSYPNWLVIPEGAAHSAEAFGYLDWLSGVGVEQWFSTVPDIPTNALAPKTNPQVVVDRRGEEFAADVSAFYAEQATIVTPMWNSPVNDFSNDKINAALQKIMTKTASPKDALAEAQTASQAELEKLLQG